MPKGGVPARVRKRLERDFEAKRQERERERERTRRRREGAPEEREADPEWATTDRRRGEDPSGNAP